MNKTTIAEINKLKQMIPSKDLHRHALFTICRIGTRYEVEEIVSKDFSHMPEAIQGDEAYLDGDYTHEFDTIQEAVSFIDTEKQNYTDSRPCLAVFGEFTQAEMTEIQTLNKILFINDKYFAFLFGMIVKDEYRTRIIEQ